MAVSITKHKIPAPLAPVYNPVVSVVTSSNQTEEGFQFIFDLYSASTAGRFSRIKMPQNPQGYGVLDAHRILENYLSYDLNPTATGVTSAINSRFKYDIQFGEEYVYYWPFGDNYFYSGDKVGFTSFTSTAHYFNVGDRIFVDQTAGYQFEEYNGVHTIIAVPTQYSIVIDVNHTASTADPGTIVYADRRKTVFSGVTASSGLCVNNAAFSHLDWLSYSSSDYDLTGGTKAFFTDAPDEYEMQLTNRAWLMAYCSSATSVSRMFVKTYAENGTTIGTYYLSGISVGDIYMKVAAGPWNIANAPFVASGSSSLPVMSTSVYSYDVFLTDASLIPLTETKTFSINQNCTKYSNIELLFQDRKGSFLTRNFQLASRQNVDIKRQEYKAPIGNYNGSTFTYNTYDRGRTIFNVDVERKYKATSNWMTENDAAYLEQLFSSPEVYLNQDGTFIPVIILSNSFEVKTTINNKLINYEIEFALAFNDEVQRG